MGAERGGDAEDDDLSSSGELGGGCSTNSAICKVGESRTGEAIAGGNNPTAALQRCRGTEKR